jgi:hypothetical protein
LNSSCALSLSAYECRPELGEISLRSEGKNDPINPDAQRSNSHYVDYGELNLDRISKAGYESCISFGKAAKWIHAILRRNGIVW